MPVLAHSPLLFRDFGTGLGRNRRCIPHRKHPLPKNLAIPLVGNNIRTKGVPSGSSQFLPLSASAGHHGLMPPDSTPLEGQLIHRAGQGDHEAYGVLYGRYSKLLHSLAYRILNDHREAEDVVQEAFLKIWEKAPSFDAAMGKLSNWVGAITRNKAIDRLRARQRYLRLFEETPDNAVVAEAADTNQPIESVRRDHAMHLRAAVNQLPQDQQHPIKLAFFEGLTHPEIAAALKTPIGTIKARIRRGLLRLRNGLGKRAGSPGAHGDRTPINLG